MVKKKQKKNSQEFNGVDLNSFSIGDIEIADELSKAEKKKLLASYELDRLIEQSGNEHSFFVNRRKKLIFTHSPHLLNLHDAKLIQKEIVEERALGAKQSRRSFSEVIKPVKLNNKLKSIASWQAPRFLFEFPNVYKLSVIQLLYSIYRLFYLFIVSIKYSIINFVKALIGGGKSLNLIYKNKSKVFSDLSILKYSSSLLYFIIIAVFLMLPFFGIGIYNKTKIVHGRVLGISQEAAKSWQIGLDSMIAGDWDNAVDNFNQASLDFAKAQSMLNSYSETLDKIPEWLGVDSTAIGSGVNLVNIGSVMTEISLKLNNIASLTNNEELDLANKLIVLAANLKEVEDLYSGISPKIAKLNTDIIPEEYRQMFTIWQSQSKTLEKYLNDVNDNLQWVLSLIGIDRPQRYLLVFQNSNELRATGGFMGSFALLDMNKGEIENMSIPGGGLYDLESQLKDYLIAPYPQQLLSSRWQIWDANWWSDWPTTAKKIAWFYESAGGPSVDGVIAINSQLIVDLVGYFEPINMLDYDKELTSSNVVTALQHAVEFEYNKVENKPKQILSDLAPILLDNIYNLPPTDLFNIASVFYDHLERDNIQIFLFDEELEKQVIAKSWSGQVPDVAGDYLQVVVQNIGGGKSDEAIKQSVDYTLLVGPDNYLIAKVTVAREHQGDISDVFTGHRNVAFIRLLTPLGSELISVDGAIEPDKKLFEEVPEYLEADDELIALDGINYYKEFDKYYSTKQFNKQVFGQWLMVDPGEVKELAFIYRLPFQISKDEASSRLASWLLPDQYKLNYTLYYDKQSGIDDQNFKFNFVMPKSLDSQWFSDSLSVMYKLGKGLYAESIINEDYQLGFILR